MDAKVDHFINHRRMICIFHRNIAYMKEQIKQLGCSFDWKRVCRIYFRSILSSLYFIGISNLRSKLLQMDTIHISHALS